METVLVAKAKELHSKLTESMVEGKHVGVSLPMINLDFVPEEVEEFGNEIELSFDCSNLQIPMALVSQIGVKNDVDGLIYTLSLKDGNEVYFQFV